MKIFGRELKFNGFDIWHKGNLSPVKDSGNTPELKSGLESAKPMATGSGIIYFATDTQKIYKDTASGQWTQMGGQDLPIASNNVLGGIKVGTNLLITEDGTLSAIDSDQRSSFIIKQEVFVATEGQTLFNLTKGSYQPNTNTISVYLYGGKQPNIILNEISSSSFEITEPLKAGDVVIVEYFELSSATPYPMHGGDHLTGGYDPIPKATTASDGLMAKEDKSKLDGIETDANKYTHPSTHSLDMITETSIKKILTADERNKITEVDNKVEKINGKGLSTEDYTTTEKNKLAGISAGAEINQNAFSNIKIGTSTISADNKTDTLELIAGTGIALTPDIANDKLTISGVNQYVHPETHPAEMIIESATKRFVSDVEKSTWNTVNNKVEKIIGKGLSTEDYTTVEKSKLANIAQNANNYTHPSTHPPIIIAQDSNNRFVTDVEKSTWNTVDNKVDNSRVLTDVPANAKFTDTTYSEITTAEIDGGVSSTLRTITARRVQYILDKVSTMISTVIGALTKSSVGLDNVDNTSDLNKPISTAQQSALDGKVDNSQVLTNVPLNAKFTDTIYVHPTGTNPHGTTKSDIGLGSADNTSDATKNVLSATKLTTPRTINGVNFDGTANITIVDSTKEPSFTKNTAFNKNFGTTVGTVTQGNDSRLSDARTPLAHDHNTLYNTKLEISALLDGKVNNDRVLTDVPLGAKFTDTVYTHPTGDGNLHVPATSTTNNGKVLKAGATAGSLIWGVDNDTITTINGKTGAIAKADIVALGIPSQDTIYTHPSTHPASMITESTTKRFVTDTEKATWNGKANVSSIPTKVSQLDNDSYYVNKLELDNSSIPFIVGTQTVNTSAWTGVTNTIGTLTSGTMIRYWLSRTSTSTAVTLDLTLKDGSTTGAIPCFYGGTSRLTTHYPTGTMILLTYVENELSNGVARTGWYAHSQYNTTYSVISEAEILTGTATSSRVITAQRLKFITDKLATVNSPTLTGTPTSTTPTNGDNSTRIATTEFVQNSLSGAGLGDMLKSVYDTNGNGIVDNAEKVNGYAVNANVPSNAKFTDTIYTHPSTHPASMITESTTKRFVSDAEKTTWNNKANASDIPNKFVHVGTSQPTNNQMGWIDTSL